MMDPPVKTRNLVILCADQLRGDCLAAAGLNPDIRTPHLDALAARGVYFTRHFATFPKCVPSRVSLVTGRYCHTDGYRTIFQHLPEGTPDLLSTCKAHGYQSALFGKNHCWENLLEASHSPPQLPPGKRGLAVDHHSWTSAFRDIFDRYRAAVVPQPPEDEDPSALRRFGYDAEQLRHGLDYRGRRRDWMDEAYTEQAVRFLREVRDPTRPFFLQLNIERPHTPYAVEEPYFSMYDRGRMTVYPGELPQPAPRAYRRQREVRTANASGDVPEAVRREVQATYYGMVSKVDALMGRVLAAVDELRLWDDTLVLLWSDHGDFAGQYGLVEKWDTCFCDALMHVPCVLAGAGLPGGRRVEALSDHTDLAPTCLELMRLPPLPGMHGSSLLPVVEGRRPGRRAVFADGGHERALRERMARTVARPGEDRKQATYRSDPDTMARAKMVRTATHKLVYRETGDHELYDLTRDRWELENLYGRPGTETVTAELMRELLDWTLLTDPDRPEQADVGA